MTTAGKVLKQVRLEKGWDLEQAAQETKIRVPFLQALEEDDYTLLPSTVIARGFLKNYAEYLGLSAEVVLALFRRDHQQEKQQVIPVGWREAVDHSQVSWSHRWRWLVVGAILALTIFYLARQYFLLAKGPYLEVRYPQGGEEFLVDRIDVTGRADTDAQVTVNAQPVILDAQGEFSYGLDLFSGENQIIIKAIGRNNQESVRQRVVFHLDK